MTTTTQKFTFKKGAKLWLDNIYEVSGLGGADWWDWDGSEGGEKIIITRDIEITIKVKQHKS